MIKKLWQELDYWFYNKRLNWQYQMDHDAESLAAWWWCIKHWWKMRPMQVYCGSGCGTRMWHNGPAERNSFCSESCAYAGAGAFDRAMNDEIPF